MVKVQNDNVLSNIAKEINHTKVWIARRTALKMRNKLIKVYDTVIDEFYSEPAKYYLRHDVENQHTEEGVNLYKALLNSYNHLDKGVSNEVDGGILIGARDMNDYRYKIPKEDVLNYVLNGTRFPATKTKPAMTFITTYKDKDCSASGNILEILNSVRDQLSERYAKEAKEEAKKELKLKYIDIE